MDVVLCYIGPCHVITPLLFTCSLQHCSLLHVPIHSRPISIEFSFDLAIGCKCPLPFEKLAYHVWILLSALIFEEWEKKRQGNQLDSSIV